MSFAESPLDAEVPALTMQEAAVTILMAAAASDGALARQEADRLDCVPLSSPSPSNWSWSTVTSQKARRDSLMR
jgi:hypothetical protein